MENRLLSPLERCLPVIRLPMQLPVERELGRPTRASPNPLEHVQRQAGDRLRQHPQAREHCTDLQGIVGADADAG